MVHAFRIVKSRWANSAFDGEGARLFGGRWNSVGTPMVYLADSVALCAMETLVHFDETVAGHEHVLLEFSFPKTCVLKPGENGLAPLPPNWTTNPRPNECADYGDKWVKSQASLILRVPSVVVPWDFNFLLNPLHPDFALAHIGSPQRFSFDTRLISRFSDP